MTTMCNSGAYMYTAIILDHVYYTIALVIASVCAFGVGLVIGLVWALML
jgi:hypothetical protein